LADQVRDLEDWSPTPRERKKKGLKKREINARLLQRGREIKNGYRLRKKSCADVRMTKQREGGVGAKLRSRGIAQKHESEKKSRTVEIRVVGVNDSREPIPMENDRISE